MRYRPLQGRPLEACARHYARQRHGLKVSPDFEHFAALAWIRGYEEAQRDARTVKRGTV